MKLTNISDIAGDIYDLSYTNDTIIKQITHKNSTVMPDDGRESAMS